METVLNYFWVLAIIGIAAFIYFVTKYTTKPDTEIISDDRMKSNIQEAEKEIDEEIQRLKEELKKEQKEPEEELPPINLDQKIFMSENEFPEPYMEIDNCEPVKACTETIPRPSSIEVLIEKAETIEVKRKYPKRIKKNSDYDKKLYVIASEKGKDISVNDMVLWNRKISKVTEIKNKKAYICTIIDGKEACKNVNISALLKATKK